MASRDLDQSASAPRQIGRNEETKPLRTIKVLPVGHGIWGDHYFEVLRGETRMYRSDPYSSKQTAITAAKREHQGRGNYRYVLEYENAKGEKVTEAL